jgi:hypothetical protein
MIEDEISSIDGLAVKIELMRDQIDNGQTLSEENVDYEKNIRELLSFYPFPIILQKYNIC